MPIRLAIGPRDLENNTIELARRDTFEKKTYPQENLATEIENLLEEIQQNIYDKALKFREDNTHYIDDYQKFKKIIETTGGFIYAHWDGTAETEEKIKSETKATIRFIPMEDGEQGKCIYSGKPSAKRVCFAKSY